jgi:competence protein ComEA
VPEPLADALPTAPEVAGDVAPVGPPKVSGLIRGWLHDRLPPWADGFVDRSGAGVIGFALAGLAALVVGVVILRHGSAGASPPSYTASATGPASDATGGGSATDPVGAVLPSPAAADTSIVVDVGGRVRKPGLVTLPPGARVADAIRAAGGPVRRRELRVVNLAARVSDGQLLLVGVKAGSTSASGTPTGVDAAGADGGGPTSATGSPASVALNSATLDQLETLPGIGPVLGQQIMDWRSAHSGFTSVAQLQQVSGIGPATYAEIAPHVTL